MPLYPSWLNLVFQILHHVLYVSQLLSSKKYGIESVLSLFFFFFLLVSQFYNIKEKPINPKLDQSKESHKWHRKREKAKCSLLIARLGKISTFFSIPADKIWDCFAVQWGNQQYLWRLPEIDQRSINHTEAGCGLHKWNWISSKCKCAKGLETCIVIHTA